VSHLWTRSASPVAAVELCHWRFASAHHLWLQQLGP
jgi:hypothetical protein